MNNAQQYVLVTGSSRGIGRAIALAFADRGASIAVHYHTRHDAADEVLAEIRARGGDGFTLAADVTREAEIHRMIDQIRQEFGTLDVLVSNARPELSAFYEPPLTMSVAAWRVALDSQATAFLVAVQSSLSLLRDRGRIIALTYSPSTRTGSWQPWAAMGSAKAAMESLMRYFAVALGPRQITVNAVSPGFVLGQAGTLDATVINGLPAEVREAIERWHQRGWTPMRRLATPADVAEVVVMLAGRAGDFITGQTLHVDGGASIMDSLSPLHIQAVEPDTTSDEA